MAGGKRGHAGCFCEGTVHGGFGGSDHLVESALSELLVRSQPLLDSFAGKRRPQVDGLPLARKE